MFLSVTISFIPGMLPFLALPHLPSLIYVSINTPWHVAVVKFNIVLQTPFLY